jgi:hypothetical protein
MKTQTEIAQEFLQELEIESLRNYPEAKKTEFWKRVDAKYFAQYPKHTT